MTKRALTILLFLFAFVGCSSDKVIVHGLDERDANDIIVFLDNKGIIATKVKAAGGGGAADTTVLWDIQVSPDKATEAMALLNAAGLPRRAGQNLLNIFSKGGLVPSELEEKIRYEAGRAEQLASVIRKIDGVLDADVQLSFPEQDPLNPNASKDNVTASVYVKHTGVLDDPNTQLIPKIRRLVASSIQGLKFDNVTVIPDRARFADLSLRATLSKNKEDMDWVRVWTLVIAKDSVRRFQLIFFGFLFLLLLLFILMAWIIWKTHMVLPSGTKLKDFLSFQPFYPEGKAPVKQEGEAEEEQKEAVAEHAESPDDKQVT